MGDEYCMLELGGLRTASEPDNDLRWNAVQKLNKECENRLFVCCPR